MRLNQFIARSGLCSRRAADQLISSGQIEVNGKIVKDFSYQVAKSDKVTHQNKLLKISVTELYAFHKPTGYITSNKDKQNRPTIYDILPEKFKNLKTIGRLDLNSEGLLLLTNDGELKRKFELPDNQLKRIYRVRFFGQLTSPHQKLLEQGLKIGEMQYRPMQIKLIKISSNSWVEVTITEGKNREIRKCFAELGYQVNRLIRTSYGKYKLDDLKKGEIRACKVLSHSQN